MEYDGHFTDNVSLTLFSAETIIIKSLILHKFFIGDELRYHIELLKIEGGLKSESLCHQCR